MSKAKKLKVELYSNIIEMLDENNIRYTFEFDENIIMNHLDAIVENERHWVNNIRFDYNLGYDCDNYFQLEDEVYHTIYTIIESYLDTNNIKDLAISNPINEDGEEVNFDDIDIKIARLNDGITYVEYGNIKTKNKAPRMSKLYSIIQSVNIRS